MNPFNLLLREVSPATRPCSLCGAKLLLMEDEDGNALALDASPQGEAYTIPQTWVLRLFKGEKKAHALKQIHYTSHAETCPEKRRK